MDRRAFTLIELLVVTAVIAALVSILMPSLHVSREQARRVQCRGSIRTLTAAWLMYKDENDGRLAGGSPESAGRGPWVQAPPDPAHAPVEERKEYIRRGTLWTYVKKMEIYQCPSDRRMSSPYHENAYRSYSIAGGMNGVDPQGEWEITPCTRYADIGQPAGKLVFLAECDPRGDNTGPWIIRPGSRQWVDPFGVWHRDNSSTLSFADGHVDTHRWLSRGLVDWNLKALHEPQGFTFHRSPQDNAETEDFDFMLRAYAYKALQ